LGQGATDSAPGVGVVSVSGGADSGGMGVGVGEGVGVGVGGMGVGVGVSGTLQLWVVWHWEHWPRSWLAGRMPEWQALQLS